MNNTTLKYGLNFTLQPVGDICPFGSLPFTIMTVITILTGLVGNIFVLKFTRVELKASPSAYLVFLMNMSVNNLTGIIISLPLFFVDFYTDIFRNISFQVANALCFIRVFWLFNCLGVGMYTLAVMSYDRYEAFTKLPSQRNLTFQVAKKTVALVWLVITLTTFCAHTGFFFAFQIGDSMCLAWQVPPYGLSLGKQGKITTYAIMVLVTIWMFTCNTTFYLTHSKVHHQIHKHMDQVKTLLGQRRTAVEINLLRISKLYIFIYSTMWVPYGVLRGVYGEFKFRIPVIPCVYAFSYHSAYLSFSILPYVYILSDKKARKKFSALWTRKSQVQPLTLDDNQTKGETQPP